MGRIPQSHVKRRVLILFPILVSSVTAQTSASLLNAGYSQPAPFLVAPGQVITFFLRGVSPQTGGSPRAGTAATAPWPFTLAGLSLQIPQSGLPALAPVPILSVAQYNDCTNAGNTSPVCFLTAVRVQIPFELAASDTLRVGPSGVTAPFAELLMEEDGKASRSFLLQPVTDNGHVVTSCDWVWDTRSDSVCKRSAYHADGHEVNATSPAKFGERIAVYAYGLGQTSPPVRAGESSSLSGSIPVEGQQRRVIVTFVDNFLNASPSVPRRIISQPFNLPPALIEFAGLAPNEVGLYQLNIPVPSTLRVPAMCGLDANIKEVTSNTILQVTTALGTENVPICVVP